MPPDRRSTARRTTRETAHRGNQAAAWGGDKDEDLIHRATVAMVREQHLREACELAAVREPTIVREAADTQAEEARMRAPHTMQRW
jgi:hypothetical protein